jgi:hypothetical protein
MIRAGRRGATKGSRTRAGEATVAASTTNEKGAREGRRFVDLRGFEPLTSSLRTKRATNCATGP